MKPLTRSRVISEMEKKFALIAWIAILVIIIAVTGGLFLPKYYKETEPWMAKDPIAWGLFVPSYVFFALASTGSSVVNSLYTIFGYKGPKNGFEKVIKQGVWFSIAMVIPAWLMIIMDLGRPDHFLAIFLSFNLMSRIAWMGLLYTIFFIILVIELIHLIRHSGHVEESTMKKIKTGELIAALVAGGFAIMVDLNLDYNLGQVFGSSTGVPAWYGAHVGILYIVLAVAIGASLEAWFLTILYGVKGGLDDAVKTLLTRVFTAVIMIATATLFIMTIWMILTAYYYPPAWEMMKHLLYGEFRGEFLGLTFILGIIVSFFIAAYAYRVRSLPAALVSAFLLALGSYSYLYSFIIGGQIARLSFHYGGLTNNLNPYYVRFWPYTYHAGTPEKCLVVMAIMIGLLLLTIGEIVLPLEKDEAPRRLWIFK